MKFAHALDAVRVRLSSKVVDQHYKGGLQGRRCRPKRARGLPVLIKTENESEGDIRPQGRWSDLTYKVKSATGYRSDGGAQISS